MSLDGKMITMWTIDGLRVVPRKGLKSAKWADAAVSSVPELQGAKCFDRLRVLRRNASRRFVRLSKV